MRKFNKIEYIILAILWLSSIISYSIALLNNYYLFTSDYLGLAGLTIASVISLYKPKKVLGSVLILLSLGLFNLLSFVYFINLVISFGFSIYVSPGIQILSLILLVVLIYKKQDEVSRIYRANFGQTNREKEQTRKSTQNRFKVKFAKLTDREIDIKLQQDLIPEAMNALTEIIEERKNAQ